jgi:hypothetical protein
LTEVEGRSYALRFGPRHLVEAADLDGMARLVRSGFLEAKAKAQGDLDACADAREMAEALAEAEERWDDLIACAYAYCGLAERVRGGLDALEGMARRGEVDRVVRAAEAEPDEFRRAAMLLAAAALMPEGVATRGALRERGAALANEFVNGSRRSEYTPDREVYCFVRALLPDGTTGHPPLHPPAQRPRATPYLRSGCRSATSSARTGGLKASSWCPWRA